jgi:hypothetical protein
VTLDDDETVWSDGELASVLEDGIGEWDVVSMDER